MDIQRHQSETKMDHQMKAGSISLHPFKNVDDMDTSRKN